MISKAEIYLVGLIVLAAGLTGMWFFAKHEGRLEERTIWESKQAAATKKDLESLTQAVGMANQIAQDTQEQLKKRKATSVIDRGVIEREIRTDVRYAADCFPPSGMRVWNDVSAGRPVVPGSTSGFGLDATVSETNVAPSAGQQGRNPLIKPPVSARSVR